VNPRGEELRLYGTGWIASNSWTGWSWGPCTT
jgi:hypothetical protein